MSALREADRRAKSEQLVVTRVSEQRRTVFPLRDSCLKFARAQTVLSSYNHSGKTCDKAVFLNGRSSKPLSATVRRDAGSSTVANETIDKSKNIRHLESQKNRHFISVYIICTGREPKFRLANPKFWGDRHNEYCTDALLDIRKNRRGSTWLCHDEVPLPNSLRRRRSLPF